MKRRVFLGSALALTLCPQVRAFFDEARLEGAGKILADAAEQGEVQSSAIYVQQGSDLFSRTWGLARDTDAMFLLASISKTISIAAVMTLFDEGRFGLDDRVQRYIPEFQGDGREKITVHQLMTHVSGLPDQLPENSRLRASHASLSEDVARFLHEFLHPTGAILKPETIKLMVSNQNLPNVRPRGLGFDLGQIGKTPQLSDETFGHTGSTGTICWAEPSTDSICVILTTLPYRAVSPHPRDLVAIRVAEALRKT